MIKHHPTTKAERLELNKKYSLKHTRLKGLSDETNYSGRTDETTSQADVGIRAEAIASVSREDSDNQLPGRSPDLST